MNYTSKKDGSTMEFSLQGAFQFDDNERVKELIKEFEDSDCSSCTLNLQELESIDSAGLGMFLLINDALGGKDLTLSKAKGQVQKMLEISKFSEMMTIVD